MIKLKYYKKKLPLLLICIIALAFLMRFYHLSYLFHFGMDQEYQAFIIDNIASFSHFPLIGVNAGDTGLYLGPYFTYLAAVPYILSSGNPAVWGMSVSFLGVVTTYVVFWVARKMYNRRIGLFASLFYGGSFLASFYDRRFWNPSFVPLLSLLLGYLIYRAAAGKGRAFVLLAAVFGLSLSSHLSLLIYLPLIFYIFVFKRQIISPKTALLSFGIFLLLQIPLIVFDVRHNFTNANAVIKLISGTNEPIGGSTFGQRNYLFFSYLGRSLFVPLYPDVFLESGQCKELLFLRHEGYIQLNLLASAAIVVFILLGIKYLYRYDNQKRSKINFDPIAIKVTLWIFFLAYIFVSTYNRTFFEYYLLFLIPWLFIAFAFTLDFVWSKKGGKKAVILFLVFYVMLNIATLLSAKSSYSYLSKKKAVQFAKSKLISESYSLEALGGCARFGGYRYLFSRFIKPPASSYMDSYFAWLYSESLEDVDPDKIVILSLIDSREDKDAISSWQERKIELLQNYTLFDRGKFDNIDVIILDK